MSVCVCVYMYVHDFFNRLFLFQLCVCVFFTVWLGVYIWEFSIEFHPKKIHRQPEKESTKAGEKKSHENEHEWTKEKMREKKQHSNA